MNFYKIEWKNCIFECDFRNGTKLYFIMCNKLPFILWTLVENHIISPKSFIHQSLKRKQTTQYCKMKSLNTSHMKPILLHVEFL